MEEYKKQYIIDLKRRTTLLNFRNRILLMRFGLDSETQKKFSRLDNALRRGHLKSVGSKRLYVIFHPYINMTNDELFESNVFDIKIETL